MSLKVGTQVAWDWGNGTAEGKVVKRYTQKITLTIKGSEITRNATEDEPAFKIEQEDGSEVLKSANEIREA